MCRKTFFWSRLYLVSFSVVFSTTIFAAKKPAVLVYTQGPSRISYPMLQYLNKQGFQVNYTGDIHKPPVPLTWDLAKNYNCIVVLAPEYGGNNKDGGHTSLETAKVLKKFMEAGGGVLLLPDMIHWDIETIFRNWNPAFGKAFGAWFLRRQVLHEKDEAKKGVDGFFYIQYHHTDKITKHPCTRRVNSIWYPAYQAVPNKKEWEQREVLTYAIRPTTDWKVLVRGSDTAYTETAVSTMKDLKIPVMDSTETEKTAPPLLAVRSYGKGRMAFMAMNAEFHFVAGFHHNKSGDMDLLKGGVALEEGLKGKKSHLLRLLVNTIKWLSAPSLAGNQLGGYKQDDDRLEDPKAGPPRAFNWQNGYYKNWQKPIVPTWKGLIGAQTSLSTGSGTVKDFAKAAKKAKLDYVVFLETFEKMNEKKLEKLIKECRDASSKDLLLIPGLYIKDNRGHHQYYFGEEMVWPAKQYLTPDGKMFDLHARKNSSGLPHIQFMVNNCSNKNTLGYFNFPASDITRMWNVKLYDSIGLFHYRNGKLIDGLKENFSDYREVNNAGCNINPLSIDLVSSPAELTKAVAEKHMLTCVKTKDLINVPKVLRYNYLRGFSVFVSNGPDIVDWSLFNNRYNTHAKSFITPNYRMPIRLQVKSEVGLKEIIIWDGLDKYMTIKLNGEKEYRQILEFHHNKEKNLILEVTDVNGDKAISSELWDDSSLNLHYWCSDRINGQLKHGPLYFFGSYGEQGISFVSKGQDSFHLYAGPLGLGAQPFESSAGKFTIRRVANRPLEVMVSEDAGVYSNKCSMFFPESEKLWNVWGTMGPLHDTELFDYFQTYIHFRNHFGRANPYNPTITGIPNRGDIAPGLNITQFIFKKDQTIKKLSINGYRIGPMTKIKGNKMILAVCRDGKSVPLVGEVDPRDPENIRLWQGLVKRKDKPLRVEYGGFWAIYGIKPGTATVVQYNVGKTPIYLVPRGDIWVYADVEGKKVKKGDILEIRTLGIKGSVPKETGAWRYQRIADYLGLDGRDGYKMKLLKGKKLPVTDGFCDLQATNGKIEFSMDKPKVGLKMVLGMRIYGLNDNWSAYCYDKIRNQARPIGTRDGIGYARFDPEYHDKTHAVVGHPVIADNKDAVVLVTHWGDKKFPYLKTTPYAYSVQVNNPTDKKMIVTLKKNMDLPSFPFEEKKLELAPGAFVQVYPEEKVTKNVKGEVK